MLISFLFTLFAPLLAYFPSLLPSYFSSYLIFPSPPFSAPIFSIYPFASCHHCPSSLTQVTLFSCSSPPAPLFIEVIITESYVDVEAYIKPLCEGMRSEQPGGENRLSNTLRLTCAQWNKQRLPFYCRNQSAHAEKSLQILPPPASDIILHHVCLSGSLCIPIQISFLWYTNILR